MNTNISISLLVFNKWGSGFLRRNNKGAKTMSQEVRERTSEKLLERERESLSEILFRQGEAPPSTGLSLNPYGLGRLLFAPLISNGGCCCSPSLWVVEFLVPSGVDPVVVYFLWLFCLCFSVVLVQADGFSGFGL
jgi:hypothetical protein